MRTAWRLEPLPLRSGSMPAARSGCAEYKRRHPAHSVAFGLRRPDPRTDRGWRDDRDTSLLRRVRRVERPCSRALTMALFPHTRDSSVVRWSNYHGTIRDRVIPLQVVPGVPGAL